MCGIAGLLRQSPADGNLAIGAMVGALAHRGPDDRQTWCDGASGIALGHRRLAIIDLSAAGRQPMVSHDGRYVLVYNGEIYNHAGLRKAIAASGHTVDWRGHSDSESLIEAIARLGLMRALELAHGMFAFAIWDRADCKLTLARDRFGEKPLYVAQLLDGIAFASEADAFRQVPGFDPAIDPQALRDMLGRGYVPAARSIYRDVWQISPGQIAMFDARGRPLGTTVYYDLAGVMREGHDNPVVDPAEALDVLDRTLGEAVARQLMSDVPLGTWLSGGIDSSLVTAFAARRASGRLQTFSIGFDEAGFDEAPAARAVAAHLGTQHREMYVRAEDALALVRELPGRWSEPFGDASLVPTYLVARFAREHVSVALSGDAGDELFGGYRRHVALPALDRSFGTLPDPLRRITSRVGMAIPPGVWTRLASLKGGQRPAFFGHKIRRLFAAAHDANGINKLYDRFLDDWFGHASPVRGVKSPTQIAFDSPELPLAAQIMLADMQGYLPADVLAKTDRAAMAVSLEGRVPFLDPEVVALAARIPTVSKIAGNEGKQILRTLLYRYVPRELVDRPKAGFAVPVAAWLKGPLRAWADELIAGIPFDGLLDRTVIEARWRAHLDDREDASQALWNVLMFLAWQRAHARA